MKAWTLLGLRVSLGWLLVIWGADKIVNPEHGVAVATKYYFGFLASDALLPIAGVLQILLGLAVVVGLMRRWVYPLQLVLNAASLFAVIGSVIDPWGWYLEDSNVLFYPSLIIFAASALMIAFRSEDRLSLDVARS
ncbi:MAG TPA: DoxX family protein [Pseudomonas xinjiangensis]|uniref:DoxX family protein n=2 Tax=root TaxID=1 RepID=A0A7V1FRH8_9GAMM|nr:DoxX family protein [Halopseudomonas xinjiangensis]HEC47674.1 DoxX family protein [Halopseudomonas xinjiangensis]